MVCKRKLNRTEVVIGGAGACLWIDRICACGSPVGLRLLLCLWLLLLLLLYRRVEVRVQEGLVGERHASTLLRPQWRLRGWLGIRRRSRYLQVRMLATVLKLAESIV